MRYLIQISILSLLIMLSIPSTASELTSTYVCDDCSYSDAIDMARSYHIQPECVAENLGNDGQVLLGNTTFSCPTTTQELIITDPINRTSFKFEVRAVQTVDWGTAYDITVTDKSMIQEERDALEMFYEIDEDFRRGMEQNIWIEAEPFISANTQNVSISSGGAGVVAMTSSNSGGPDCSNHASQIFGSAEFRNNVENQSTQQITRQMGLSSWKDFTSQIDTNVSLSLGTSLGVSINFSQRQNSYFVTREDDNGGKLVYEVSYHGEKREITRLPRLRSSTERFLNLNFKLIPGVSTIDGYRITSLFGGYTDLTEIPISVCLSEMLTKLLNTKTLTEGGGSGSLIDAVGFDASNGGTLIPRANTWTNLGGCRIVEGTGQICRAGTNDCVQVRADYIDC
ncbi:hypothetical protein [Alteromonas macleodii]|uniref:Uncharacterized protein n=1 Tax=Alteromonas macleodii TaxID=28108 RepID=A0A6T9Y3E0_ALTMA|nr:hypothetical protein [Alteromonas macleodii]CAB9494766.1 exported protein of unknown function [Alteromonas macleodii]